jgi:hypothetical protein
VVGCCFDGIFAFLDDAVFKFYDLDDALGANAIRPYVLDYA